MKPRKILENPREGTATGLFATSQGGGGILHIEIKQRRPRSNSNLELTGNLGTIMQESIKVAYTNIWYILSQSKLEEKGLLTEK